MVSETGGKGSTMVQTVLGAVAASELGVTLAHEHVFFDLRTYFTRAEDDPEGVAAEAELTPERLWWIRMHPMNSRVNLVQEDAEVAVSEVEMFGGAGGGTLVDVTTVGLSPKPEALVEVSERTGGGGGGGGGGGRRRGGGRGGEEGGEGGGRGGGG